VSAMVDRIVMAGRAGDGQYRSTYPVIKVGLTA
jgi:hypothetical protein